MKFNVADFDNEDNLHQAMEEFQMIKEELKVVD